MTKYPITIIMPVFNGEKYISDAVNDLICQTYPYFELICIDDGSTDNTLKYLTDVSKIDKRIHVIKIEHGGAARARNVGIHYAQGEYMLFLDCDDRFESYMLEKIVEYVKKNETDILIFDASRFDSETGAELTSDRIIRKNRLPAKKIFYYEDCPEEIFGLSVSTVWNKLYRAKFVRENELYFQDVPYLNDMYFNHMALVKAKSISFLDQKLIQYRQNRSGAISDSENRQKNPLCVCKVAAEIKRGLIEFDIYQKVRESYFISVVSQMMWTLEVLKGHEYFLLYDAVKKTIIESNTNIGFSVRGTEDEWIEESIIAMKNMDASEYLFYTLGRYKKMTEYLIQDAARLLKKSNELMLYKKWIFDVKKLEKGNRVIVYGAGNVGTDYIEQFTREKTVEVVAWVDKRYREVSNEKKKVESPEIIRGKEFDHIIIAILNEEIRNEVGCYLETIVASEKIIYPTFDL